MTAQSSPAIGASRATGTVVPYDRAKHKPELHRVTWEPTADYDGAGKIQRVIELEPETTEKVFTSDELEQLPDFFDGLQPGPTLATAERATTARASGKVPEGEVPRKLIYAEELAAGRADLTDAEYRLLMAMWKYADNATLGDIFPGHGALAEHVNLSGKSGRDKIRTRIGALVRKGYAVKVREGRTKPTRQAAAYRLTLPEWAREEC